MMKEKEKKNSCMADLVYQPGAVIKVIPTNDNIIDTLRVSTGFLSVVAFDFLLLRKK